MPVNLLQVKFAEKLILLISFVDDTMSSENFQFEVAVMHAMQSYTKHTVGLLGWCSRPMGICMEMYDSSLDRINEPRREGEDFFLTIYQVYSMMKQVCEALHACEQLMIVHNDLKPGISFHIYQDTLKNE